MYFNKKITEIEKKIGYTFKDKSLLRQAFTRTSYCNEKNYRGRENYSSNEVLEFFGDSVLSTAIISVLLNRKTERYAHGIKTELTEGDMSNIRSKLSDKRNLSRSMAALGLHKHLLMGEGDEKLGVADEASVMEDLFESIIGAVYIDCGMNISIAIQVVTGMLDVDEYLSGEAPVQSYKNALQEWCADKKRRLPPPIYKTVGESGPDHKKIYERGCYIGDKLWGTGTGKNQKLADSSAAEAALAALKAEWERTEAKRQDALSALKALAAKQKLPSPEYHDLGAAPVDADGVRKCIIECCFMGFSVSGVGGNKQDAREIAASKMLELVAAKKSGLQEDNGAKPARTAKKKKTNSQKQSAPLGKSSAPNTAAMVNAKKQSATSGKSAARNNAAKSNKEKQLHSPSSKRKAKPVKTR